MLWSPLKKIAQDRRRFLRRQNLDDDFQDSEQNRPQKRLLLVFGLGKLGKAAHFVVRRLLAGVIVIMLVVVGVLGTGVLEDDPELVVAHVERRVAVDGDPDGPLEVGRDEDAIVAARDRLQAVLLGVERRVQVELGGVDVAVSLERVEQQQDLPLHAQPEVGVVAGADVALKHLQRQLGALHQGGHYYEQREDARKQISVHDDVPVIRKAGFC